MEKNALETDVSLGLKIKPHTPPENSVTGKSCTVHKSVTKTISPHSQVQNLRKLCENARIGKVRSHLQVLRESTCFSKVERLNINLMLPSCFVWWR